MDRLPPPFPPDIDSSKSPIGPAGWPVWLLMLCALFYGLVLGLLLWFLAPAIIRALAEWAR